MKSYVCVYKRVHITHCHVMVPQIVDVNLTSEGKTKLEIGATLTFSYQVRQVMVGW